MLQARSFRTANQENPHAPQQQHPSKTPLRQQPLAGPSKGAFKEQAAPQTGKSGRVLGNKDGNQGRQSNPDALQVAPTKPKAPLLLSPPPAPVLPVHLRTPSPGLQRLAALSHQISPEASLELEQDLEDEEEVDCEDEVEYAGASAADYDEPYEDASVPDLKNGNFGALLRSLPIAGSEGHEAWEAHDAAERAATKFAPDAPVEQAVPRPDESCQPMFPLPARRALATKSSNLARSTLSNSTRLPPPSNRAPPSSVRATPSSSRLTVARPPPSALSSRPASVRPSPAISRTLSSTTTRPAIPSTVPRKPLASSLARPTPARPAPTVARPAPTPAFARTPAPTPLRLEKSSASLAPSLDDDEAALGIFGITDRDAAFGDEMVDDGFRFEL